MSRSALKGIQAAAGAASDPVYVDDVFSTFLYEGNGNGKRIQNNIKLADGAENNTFLQITGDGSISDVSPFGHTLTPSSTATTSTSVKKFGTGSLDLSYDASTFPTISAPLDTAPRGDEDFTVEGWIYHGDAAATFRCIYSSGVSLQIYMNNRNVIAYCSESPSGSIYFVNGIGGNANSVSNNTWAHFAFVRHGNTFTVYVNGVGGTATTSSQPVGSAARSLIGAYTTSSYGFTGGGANGYIDDFRITRGRAVYTANFTPPSSAHSLDTQVTGEGGLVWIKDRETDSHHIWTDTERGATKTLWSGSDGQYYERTENTYLNKFHSDGFEVGSGSEVNNNNKDNVGWTFRKQPGFFDVVTWTGDGTDNRDISHNLGATVGCLILKRTDTTSDWEVYHRGLHASFPQAYKLQLHTSNAKYLANTAWGNPEVAPSSTSFRVNNATNTNNATYVAYLFAHDAQDFGTDSDEAIIKCGSYTGDGSTSGTVIDLGFEPQFVMIKNASRSATDWILLDAMRGIVSGGNDAVLKPNASAAGFEFEYISATPNGFEHNHNGSYTNFSGDDYIYMAIRRPHKPASEFAATDLFKTVTGRSDSGSPSYVTGFVTDMGIQRAVASADNNFIMARQAGNKYSYTNSNTTSFANTGSSIAFDYMNGALDYFYSAAYRWWGWRRAPGFFDVVTWKGTGSAKTIPHNLGVAPEMIWVFTRDYGERHAVYSKVSGNQAWLDLSYTYSANADSAGAYWNSTDPTASVFSVGTNYRVNDSSNSYGLYYGFLFASVAGISKVGSYTGTGGDINVDCGFSNGARFVLIKTTTWSSGHWFLFDSERGMSSGNDPYIVLDTTAVSEEGALDAIDPLSSGFIVKGTAGNGMNKSGETYLFYAIA